MSGRINRTTAIGVAIFAFTLLVFMISHVHQVADSAYSMMLSQSLLDHRSFTLDHYPLPDAYQIESVNGHRYYRFPPGTPVLSVPIVGVLNLLGVSAVNSDGTYNPRGEMMIEAGLAALLMATLTTIFYYTALLLLPPGWSALVALGGALGTQVYSTASRALWSDTWGIFLLGIVVFLMLAHEVGKRRLNPFVLASLLAWTYFVRPTFAVAIAAISIYILLFHRPFVIRFAATGAVWLAAFVIYSWVHFGQLLPSYYRANRLQFNVFWTALAGNLISPARGVLIYVPILFFVAYLLLRYRDFLTHMRLVWLALSIIAAHLIGVSGFPHWWGGHSFGPRFTTGLVPWFVLLGILGIKAMLRWRSEQKEKSLPLTGWRIQLALGGTLLVLSAVINTLGATSHATWLWNVRPRGVDEHPERLWDWRQPQFLAGYLPYPPPADFPAPGMNRVDFTVRDSEKYFWYGWNEGAPESRWTEQKAALVFSLVATRPDALRINVTPYFVPGKLERQRLDVSLNGQLLTSVTLNSAEAQVITLSLRPSVSRERNVLIFESPDAQSPQKLRDGEDPRPRGIKLNWMELVGQQ
ncbi:MAG: hypothetical protein ABJB97_03510 [Acidobacteriota bacterium]